MELFEPKEYLPDGQKMLLILGKEYKAHNTDWYIFDALEMMNRCKKERHLVTYEMIMWLRTWIRENYQHGHNIDYSRIRTLSGAAKWLQKVIRAEYLNAPGDFKEDEKLHLERTRELFNTVMNHV